MASPAPARGLARKARPLMMRSKLTGDFLDPATDSPEVANVYVHLNRDDERPDDDPLVEKFRYAFVEVET